MITSEFNICESGDLKTKFLTRIGGSCPSNYLGRDDGRCQSPRPFTLPFIAFFLPSPGTDTRTNNSCLSRAVAVRQRVSPVS